MNLEDELKAALRREQPPEGFAGRVLTRVARQKRKNMSRVWMAIAAMLIAGAFITVGYRDYEARHESAARKAGHELMVALKITGNKLHTTGKMIRRRPNGV